MCTMAEEKTSKDLHKNHRDRLRKKLMWSDGEVLEPHEMLEILLYSVNAQKDTNGIARALLKRFGSVYNVFAASEEDLMSIPGVGKQSATLLKLQGTLLRQYNADKMNVPKNLKLTPKNAGAYVRTYFEGYSYEMVIAFVLDAECNVITAASVAKGTDDMVQAYVRNIVKLAMDTKAVYVILAHNHPGGTLTASENDIEFTLALERALTFINIRLVDHIIVAGDKHLSLANEFHLFD